MLPCRSQHYYHRRRRRRAGALALPPPPPPKNREKCFRARNHVKFGHSVNFFRAYIVKYGNFVNFSGKYHVQFGHFLIFHVYIFGQKCLAPPKVDWAPTPMIIIQCYLLPRWLTSVFFGVTLEIRPVLLCRWYGVTDPFLVRKVCYLVSCDELSLSILLTRCLLFQPVVYSWQRNISWKWNAMWATVILLAYRHFMLRSINTL